MSTIKTLAFSNQAFNKQVVIKQPFLKKVIVACLLSIGLVSPSWADYTHEVSHEQALSKLNNPNVIFLDVRSAWEYQQGHVPGAVNIPYDQLESQQAQLAKWQDKEVILYCRSGRRASIAERTLLELGLNSRGHLTGDMIAWEANNLKLEK